MKTIIKWEKYKDVKPEFDRPIVAFCNDGSFVLIRLIELVCIGGEHIISVSSPEYIEGYEYEVCVEPTDIKLWAYQPIENEMVLEK
jgi:hypothetical protein